MRINDKLYCDVCMKRIDNEPDNNYYTYSIGSNIDRHYCKEHRVIGDAAIQIEHGNDIGTLVYLEDKEQKSKEKKEVSNLELYDEITELFSKYCGILLTIIPGDKQFNDFWKKSLDADIAYYRLKLKGVVKDDN